MKVKFLVIKLQTFYKLNSELLIKKQETILDLALLQFMAGYICIW